MHTVVLHWQKRYYTSRCTCIQPQGLAVCFEGVRIGQKFNLWNERNFSSLHNLKKIYQNNTKILSWHTYRSEVEYDGNVLRSNLDKTKPVRSLIGQLERLQTGIEINSAPSGELYPYIKIIMNISRNWNDYKAVVFIFFFLELLSSCKWILVYTLFCNMILTNVKHVKYKKGCVLLRYWHQFHDGHSWTPGNDRRDQMPGRSHCPLVVYPKWIQIYPKWIHFSQRYVTNIVVELDIIFICSIVDLATSSRNSLQQLNNIFNVRSHSLRSILK